MSPLLRAYLGFSHISAPLWRMAHRKRVKQGKELPHRLPEKYGVYKSQRPTGTVLWFHALSVGESLALVPLIERALSEMPEAHVVLTTSTATSVAALDKAGLPDRAHHVLLPIDTAKATRAFLDHWKPDIAAFAELDFWPRLMVEAHRRGVPMVLINSRMPDHNFEKRRKLGGAMRDVLQLFDRLLVQDETSATRFATLGADADKIEVLGALKAAARPLPCDSEDLADLQASIGLRPVWLAAATIAAEHGPMIEAHRRVSMKRPNALLIIAPRHTADGESCEELARAVFPNVARRGLGQTITSETQIYIADTIGEMGLWYRLAPVSFVGHSLDDNLEGKNPFEAAALGSAILHGPHMSYFSESYAALASMAAAQEVTSPETLAKAVLDLQSTEKRDAMTQGAKQVIEAQRAVLTTTWDVLKARLKV